MTSRQEIWNQDPFEKDLWMNEDGLLVNTAALEERTYLCRGGAGTRSAGSRPQTGR